MGVASGCGCKEVYRFPHTTYPYSSDLSLHTATRFLVPDMVEIYTNFEMQEV